MGTGTRDLFLVARWSVKIEDFNEEATEAFYGAYDVESRCPKFIEVGPRPSTSLIGLSQQVSPTRSTDQRHYTAGAVNWHQAQAVGPRRRGRPPSSDRHGRRTQQRFRSRQRRDQSAGWEGTPRFSRLRLRLGEGNGSGTKTYSTFNSSSNAQGAGYVDPSSTRMNIRSPTLGGR